jgi:hypothetical protein
MSSEMPDDNFIDKLLFLNQKNISPVSQAVRLLAWFFLWPMLLLIKGVYSSGSRDISGSEGSEGSEGRYVSFDEVLLEQQQQQQEQEQEQKQQQEQQTQANLTANSLNQPSNQQSGVEDEDKDKDKDNEVGVPWDDDDNDGCPSVGPSVEEPCQYPPL